jgi:hypothetical protein
MRKALRFLVVALALIFAVGAPARPAGANDKAPNPDAVCDCQSGTGGCELYFRAPAGATYEPCFCDRCREYQPHDGMTVPDGMSRECFQSSRMDCYLKRHCVAWRLACSECVQREKCCPFPNHANCPNCDGDTDPLATDYMGRPAKETVLATSGPSR